MLILNGNEPSGGYLEGLDVIGQKTNYKNVWFDCVDAVTIAPPVKNVNMAFSGSTIMKYDPDLGTGTFKSNASCSIGGDVQEYKNRLAIVLPNGFVFSEGNPGSVKLFDWKDSNLKGCSYEDNKMYFHLDLDSYHEGTYHDYRFTETYTDKDGSTVQIPKYDSTISLKVELRK